MSDISRSSSFPSTFIFGVATSSVQIEGATSEGGRGKGIWDSFASIPGKIVDGSTPAVTCDHFHRFKEDILEVKRLGVEAYRLSISWTRLFPETSDTLNKEGVIYYNHLIDCIVEAGLIPFVTLYHWDLPQFLQDDPHVKGWSTKNIIKHFSIFVNACFKCFGDRVKNWITFNEIHLSTVLAYEIGIMAPGRALDASTNPYIVAHHQLLSHAATVKLYRADYQTEQRGSIGISTDIMCYEPMSDTQEDIDAAARCQEFEMGWILDPVQFGEYPQAMKELAGERLPRFTDEESRDLKGSIDFIGLNYYFALWATKAKPSEDPSAGFNMWLKESQTEIYWKDAHGKLLGELMGSPEQSMFRSCPWGLRKVLAGLDSRYGKIPIYITENGIADPDMSRMLDGPLNDQHRIKFLQDHVSELSDSIRLDKVNVKGYFHWTLMDAWEWMSGFTLRFGLYYVDFNDPQLPRQPKASAKWLSSFLKS